MLDSNVESQNEPNYLEMSDEDIINAAEPVAAVASEEAEEDTTAEEVPSNEAVAEEKEQDAEAEDSDAGDGKADQADAEPQSVDEVAADDKTTDSDEKTGETDGEKDKKDAAATDYKAEYERFMAPFKANGREIQVKSVEDAIALMQMGANYNKKMAALKPNLKLMKMLENNQLLSEEKLSFLIELDKKNPDAINKLVKDSGLNPMDLDTEKAGEYKPKIHAIDDKEIELDTVLDDIQESSAYNRTLDIVSRQWDGASKQVIASNPQILKIINSHIESGVYDIISKEIESERVFGRLNGLSDIEAYRQVGDAIQARGGFNHLGSADQGKPAAKAPVVVQPKPKKADDDKLNEKRRAAGSTKPAVPSSTPKDFNPLALSDEEFSKLAENKYR